MAVAAGCSDDGATPAEGGDAGAGDSAGTGASAGGPTAGGPSGGMSSGGTSSGGNENAGEAGAFTGGEGGALSGAGAPGEIGQGGSGGSDAPEGDAGAGGAATEPNGCVPDGDVAILVLPPTTIKACRKAFVFVDVGVASLEEKFACCAASNGNGQNGLALPYTHRMQGINLGGGDGYLLPILPDETPLGLHNFQLTCAGGGTVTGSPLKVNVVPDAAPELNAAAKTITPTGTLEIDGAHLSNSNDWYLEGPSAFYDCIFQPNGKTDTHLSCKFANLPVGEYRFWVNSSCGLALEQPHVTVVAQPPI